jgi:hypothetical protein
MTTNVLGSESVAIGTFALNSQNPASATNMYNVAVGHNSGAAVTTGVQNTLIGALAGDAITSGSRNQAFGYGSLSSVTTADNNLGVGRSAGANVTTGNTNTLVGAYNGSTGGAGQEITTGSKNTILGAYNGNMGGLDIRTSDNQIVLSDGDGNPRGFFNSSGNFFVGRFSSGNTGNGHIIRAADSAIFSRDASGETVQIGRNANDGDLIRFYKNGTQVGNVSVSGSTTAYNTSSDHRLKENVVYDWDATTRLKQLKPARFNFIADADITVDGFLAHEAQAVVPEAVTGTHNAVDDDGVAVMQGIDQSKLVPLLVKAVQEQQALIDALTARIETLEG